jgi:phenylalanyl-tRNA synthetase beta chain
VKISLNWLKDYVALPKDLSAERLAYDLTMTTVEVEGWVNQAQSLEGIVVGKIISIRQHPNADRLRIAMTDIGGDTKQIVCGGSNLSEGMLVAVAPPGAKVRWHGEGDLIELKESEIRGEKSFGMICASSEIGLAELYPTNNEREILDLTSTKAKAGESLSAALEMNDVIFEIDNKSLTNRPDLWGHYGIARELAAIYKLPLKPLKTELSNVVRQGPLAVNIQDPQLCRRYTATTFSGVLPEESPDWIRRRLISVGQRPINLIVDLTNYVMFAVGQPTHAFDARLVSGNEINVRRARDGEELELLDSSKISLNNAHLVIADKEKPTALAGIMGGKFSGIQSDTSQLVLESASFHAGTVRKGSAGIGVRTDSSIRFEKGIDTDRVVQAVEMFASMLKMIQPNVECTGTLDVFPTPDEAVTVDVTRNFIVERIGRDFSISEIQGLLGHLGFSTRVSGESLSVSVPSWRATGDVSIPADIVEEVARLHGYDNLEFVPPPVYLTKAIKQPAHEIDRRIREYLAISAGFVEVFTYPWVEDRVCEALGITPSSLTLEDPVSPDAASLVTSLIPNLLSTVERNCRYETNFGVFEVGRVFRTDETGVWSHDKERLPVQPKHLCLMLVGSDAKNTFLRLKGIVEAMFHILPIESVHMSSEEQGSSWAAPDSTLRVTSGATTVGEIGLLSARSLRKLGIPKLAVVAAEISLDKLIPLPATTFNFKPIPKFPQVQFDLAMLFDLSTPWARIADCAGSADPRVVDVRFADEYRGEQIPEGKRSIAIEMIFSDPDKTLTSDETQQIAAKVISALESKVGAARRER